VVTDSHGSFGLALKAPTLRQSGGAIVIPADAVPGTHSITAVERITQLQAQVLFTVRTDWAQFQFEPDHTGLNPYENVLSPDNVGNLTLRWVGPGVGTPVVADGVLYVEDFSLPGFHALNADTGAPLWSYINQASYSAPAVANGVGYFGSYDNYVYALNATSGALLWKRPEDSTNSPTVANGVVYVLSSCNVDALNADTGKLLWTYEAGCHWGIQGAPAVANGEVYFGSDDGYLYALDASTGALLWKFLGTQYFAYAAPAVVNGIVYALSLAGDLYAVNANTGVFIWKYATGGGGLGLGSPAVANGVVYVAGGGGNLYALDAGTGALLWQYTTNGIIYSSPAVANGVVYFGNSSHNVYALNASTGESLWQFTTSDEILSSSAVVNGMVYISDGLGYLYAFGLPSEQMSEKFSPPERPDPARLTPNWGLQTNTAVTPPRNK
jgi:eukaryotic-like serine/threonine-protein kinase